MNAQGIERYTTHGTRTRWSACHSSKVPPKTCATGEVSYLKVGVVVEQEAPALGPAPPCRLDKQDRQLRR